MQHHRFSRTKAAGQDQRVGAGNWEKATNKQQRKLVKAYDEWGVKVRKQLLDAAKSGATEEEMEGILDKNLNMLEKTMGDITTEGIDKAARLSVKGLMNSPEVIAARLALTNATLANIRNGLIPKTKESLMLNIGKTVEMDRRAVVAVFKPMRSGVAQYAGGMWEAIFETQKAAGKTMEREAIEKGETPPKIKWVLDKMAQHCKDSPGFYGCTTLAGEYKSWNDLPTVPAGKVTCRGNCRCHLEVFINGKWQRGLS